ncbi:hypothetical protein BN11_210022 [Nostocoides australiense Ben110]|uniref:Uncharacterized protein n=1 Tax=Nostocoides australiense Ben110 TaxID=1193182 RepID=W6JVD0_9MICO|nr:hypothetical protein BN11_210022 [Tetrasphaera australiensis Ben110]
MGAATGAAQMGAVAIATDPEVADAAEVAGRRKEARALTGKGPPSARANVAAPVTPRGWRPTRSCAPSPPAATPISTCPRNCASGA